MVFSCVYIQILMVLKCNMASLDYFLTISLFRNNFLGYLGGTAVWRLPLAQGVILETRDQIPR